MLAVDDDCCRIFWRRSVLWQERVKAHLQLFPNGTRGFWRTRVLDANNLDQIGNAAVVILFIFRAGETLDIDGYGRIRLLLLNALVSRTSPRTPAAQGG